MTEKEKKLKNISEPLIKKVEGSFTWYTPTRAKWRITRLKIKTYYFVHQIPKTAPIFAGDINKREIEEAEKAVVKQRSTKKRWLNFLFMAVNLGIVAGLIIYQFSTDDAPVSLGELFTFKINWWFVFVGFVVFMLIMLFDTLRIHILIKQSTKRRRLYLSYKTNAIGRFYDNITPFYTGGQAFQIYYMNKRGISGGTASGVPIAKFIMHQIVFTLMCLVVLIVQHAFIVRLDPYVMVACYVGLSLMLALVLGVLFLSISKRVGPALSKGVLKLLNKMRIVKNYEESYIKMMRGVKEYSSTLRFFLSNPKVLIPNLILSVLLPLCTYSLPFVVYCIFMPFDINMWFELFTIAIVCDLASSISPLPGGAGVAEISFNTLFGLYFIGTGLIVWAMLLWRFFNYYLVLLHGLGVIFYDYLVGNRKVAKTLQKFKKEDDDRESKKQRQLARRTEEEKHLGRAIIKLPHFKKTKDGYKSVDD